ncbi:MAG TPA: pca operon transcription factor PcaQ [Burkholderiales bacterium]
MLDTLSASRIRLRHIHCFVAVAQERGIGKAAERLRLTQPAVSKTLAELEDILGVRLFERGRGGAQLTREGELFLGRALAVREALEAALSAVGSVATPAETLRIGALPTLAPDLLPPALKALRRLRPETRVLVRTGTNTALLEMLKAGALDFALGRMAEPADTAGLAFELLYVEPLVLVTRPDHPLAARTDVSLTEVLRYPLLVSVRGTTPRRNAESLLQARGLRLPANCTETLSVSVGRLLVKQSDTVWFVSAGAVRDDLESGLLATLSVPTEGTEEPVGLLHRTEGELSAAARVCMNIVRQLAERRRAAR